MINQSNSISRRWWILSPSLGIGLFGLLYVMAACQYPGGSNANHTAIGFDWQHNYWCDLLGAVAKNGLPNQARPFARGGMLVLGVSLSVFWWLVPRLYQSPNYYVRVIRWAGAVAMVILFYIDTPYHDLAINLAGGLALLSVGTTFVGLYWQRKRALLNYGLVCMALIAFNNYVYYTHHWLTCLPVLQKVSFIVVLGWFVAVNWTLYQQPSPGPTDTIGNTS